MDPRKMIMVIAIAWSGAVAVPALCAPTPEALAGEDDKAVPTAQPTAAADVRNTVSVTRSAQAAPAFQLPDFVITGSGEHKALARRDGQGAGLDTSGGLRTSPGEKGAGKDQLDARAERSSAEERTYTVRTEDAWVRMAAGLAGSAFLDGYYGRSQGPLAWSLQGGGYNTDGGPVAPGLSLAQRRDGALKGGLSYSSQGHGLFEMQAMGEGRSRRWTRALQADAWSERDRFEVLGAWAGEGVGLEASGGRASARLGGLGSIYSEEGGSLGLHAEKIFSGHSDQDTLLGDLSAEALSQRGSGQRQLALWKADFRSRFEPFKHAKLTLGLGLDAVTGDANEILLGPRLEWQQRLSPAWGWNARFSSGLDISRLRSAAWSQDYRLPDPHLPVSRRVADIQAGLQWQAASSLGLEASAFAKQNEGYYLPDDPGRSGLWLDVPVRNYREIGLGAKERWQKTGYWQELELRFLRPEVSDLPGATATFAPAWTGKASLGGEQGAWHARLAVEARSEMEAVLHGGWTLPAAAILSAELGRHVTPALDVFVEGKNLTLAPWGDAPDYPEASPYAGLGLEYSF
jgi:hypothetical protein